MISDERMVQIIKMAQDAAKIADFTPCGMGLAPRIGFSNEIYKQTLATLVEIERAKSADESIGADELTRLKTIEQAARRFDEAGCSVNHMSSKQWEAYTDLKALFHGGIVYRS